MNQALAGPYAPVLTPFDEELGVDIERYVEHARWLLAHGVGLAPFGTTSEAASLSMSERLFMLDALLEAGVDPSRLLPGTGLCSVQETVALTTDAVRSGACGVLVLPPHYYKPVDDDGLFGWFSDVIEKVGDARLRLVLYNIPQLTQVPITPALVERLLARYGQTVAGLKDSSGDWRYTRRMIESYAPAGLRVFPSSESLMPAALEIGGAGCISATANVNPGQIARLYTGWRSADTMPELVGSVNTVRTLFQSQPTIPFLKHAMAHWTGVHSWRLVRPPICAFQPRNVDELARVLDALACAHALAPCVRAACAQAT